MAADNPSIRILVSCHKPVRWPIAECYLPIQLGAASAQREIAGSQPDNEGENISDRNFTFCEMTAQYWGWKHVEADYIGLCHYRRYFCFDGLDHEKNDHAQIEIDCLSERSIWEYCLADEDLIRSKVTESDIVIPERWVVDKVPTPLGPQPTVRKHMVAYGLMDDDSIDKLLMLCSDLKPEYEPYVREYLEGNIYQGYNCFIMRRSLFEQLSEFEFTVLEAFDASFDYSDLTATKKRIVGYFGEILISAFTMKMEREGLASVSQWPLTFFEDTPEPVQLGVHGDLQADEELVWCYPGASPAECAVGLSSLVDSGEFGDGRGATVLVAPKFDTAKAFALAGGAEQFSSLSWATWPVIDRLPVLSEELSCEDSLAVLPFLLPWLLPNKKRALFVSGTLLWLGGDVASVTYAAAAAVNVRLQRELNKPDMAGHHMLADERGRTPVPLGTHFLSFDLELFRQQFEAGDILELYLQTKHRVFRSAEGPTPHAIEVVQARMLSDLGFSEIPLSIVSQSLRVDDTNRWANAELVKEWGSADCPEVVIFGEDGAPDASYDYRYEAEYWQRARRIPAYEALLVSVSASACSMLGYHEGSQSIWGRLLPEGSLRGRAARAFASAVHLR